MALIQYAAPRDRQPQEAVGVDWDNPIAKDLAVAVNPGTGIDHVTGRPLTPSGTYTKSIGDKGLTFKGPDTQVAGNWSVPVNIPEHWDCTILVIGLSNADYVFGGGSYPHFSINSAEISGLFFSGQTLQAQITNNNFTQVDGQTAGKTYTYAAVKRNFNQGDHYIDGVYRNTTTIGYRTISAATTAYVGRASGVNIEKAQSFLCLYFTRALSAAEIKSVSDNPWQLFAPQTIPVPVSAGGGTVTLAAQDAAHAHALDNAALSIGVTLTVADLAHGHALDASTLSTGTALAVADAQHAHALDNVTLSTTGATSLTVADLLHAHTLDAVVLTSQTDLAAADMAHAHALDGVTLDTDSTLAVADVLHAHALGNVVLGAEVALTVADALHAHALNGVTLTVGSIDLVIAGVMHAHALDTLALTLDTYLAIADALHAHALDNADLSLDTYLVVADALHAHAIDNLTLSFPATGALSDAEFRQMYDWLYALSQKQLLTVGTFLALK